MVRFSYMLSLLMGGLVALLGAVAPGPLGAQTGFFFTGNPILFDSDPTDNADPTQYTNDFIIYVRIPGYSVAPEKIYLANNPDFANAEQYAFEGQELLPYRLSGADGIKTVYMRGQRGGSFTNTVQASIRLDTVPPVSEIVTEDMELITVIPSVVLDYFVRDIDNNRDIDNTRASGTQGVKVIYSKDGGAPQQYNGEFSTSRVLFLFDTLLTGLTGKYEIWTIATDNAGNREEAPGKPDMILQIQVLGETFGFLEQPRLFDIDPTDNRDPENFTNNREIFVKYPPRTAEPEVFHLSLNSQFEPFLAFENEGQDGDKVTLPNQDGEWRVFLRGVRSFITHAEVTNTVSQVIELDRHPPESEITSPSAVIVSTDPVFNVNYFAVDEDAPRPTRASGAAGVRVIYSKDGDNPQQYNGEFPTSRRGTVAFDTSLTGGSGRYDLWSVAVDTAGNFEQPPPGPDATIHFTLESTDEMYWIVF